MTGETAYDGHVDRGDEATWSAEGGLRVTKLSVGPMDNNAYVLRSAGSHQALLVDAADEPDRLLRALDGLDLVAVVTTHGHRDHWQALQAVRVETGAPALLHPEDRDMVPWTPDELVRHGDVVAAGPLQVEVRHTPGHTPGSVCLLVGTHLFTGDTLFPGGPGRTSEPEQFERVMRSLREQLFVLPDGTRVCPGHGDDTTIGGERPHLREWQERGW